MIVEVSGAGFHNMGAELMLVAARDEMLSWSFVDDIAINIRIGTHRQRARAGISSVLRLDSEKHPWARRGVALVAEATPRALLGLRDAYKPSQVDAVIDASGFAFGDQWGPNAAIKKAALFERFRRRGLPIVLLPQAFGPFERSDVAQAATSALELVDLIFARDPESLAHLRGLPLTRPRIEMAGDFTNLVEPEPLEPESPTVVLIPNGRMVEMVEEMTAEAYLDFLVACTSSSRSHGFEVVAFAHEAMDIEFAEGVRSRFGGSVTLFSDMDPVAAKALVGGASLVISSRFHGLVNAFSQAVPAIGTGWSHKYAQLAADYHCPDSIWKIEEPESVQRNLEAWLSDDALESRRSALQAPSAALKDASIAMWGQVRATIASGGSFSEST